MKRKIERERERERDRETETDTDRQTTERGRDTQEDMIRE